MRKATATTSAPAQDSCGFVALYERSVGDVYSYLASRTGDRRAAEELTQDVFVAGVVLLLATSWMLWLIGVARHKLVDHWRARAREDRTLALVEASERSPWSEEPVVIEPELAAVVLAALSLCIGRRWCCGTSTGSV